MFRTHIQTDSERAGRVFPRYFVFIRIDAFVSIRFIYFIYFLSEAHDLCMLCIHFSGIRSHNKRTYSPVKLSLFPINPSNAEATKATQFIRNVTLAPNKGQLKQRLQ